MKLMINILTIWHFQLIILFLTGIIHQEKIYIADSSAAEMYDPATGVWKSWPAPSLNMSLESCMVAWKDTFLLMGNNKLQVV